MSLRTASQIRKVVVEYNEACKSAVLPRDVAENILRCKMLATSTCSGNTLMSVRSSRGNIFGTGEIDEQALQIYAIG